MKYREAEAAAKRLTEETGKKHQAVNRERVDTEGFTVSEWFVEPADGAPSTPKGMTLEEAKAHQEQANRDRPFGLSWAMIEKKQGGKLK